MIFNESDRNYVLHTEASSVGSRKMKNEKKSFFHTAVASIFKDTNLEDIDSSMNAFIRGQCYKAFFLRDLR